VSTEVTVMGERLRRALVLVIRFHFLTPNTHQLSEHHMTRSHIHSLTTCYKNL
jgi:hypothetical protein